VVTINDQPVKKPGRALLIIGSILTFGGLLFAFSPMLLAFLLTQPGHNPFSEGDAGSAGTLMWLMIVTLPVGGIASVVGLVVLTIGIVVALRQPLPDIDTNPSLRFEVMARRAKILGFLATPQLLITHLIIIFVTGNMLFSKSVGQTFGVVWAVFEITAIAFAVFFAAKASRKGLFWAITSISLLWISAAIGAVVASFAITTF